MGGLTFTQVGLIGCGLIVCYSIVTGLLITITSKITSQSHAGKMALLGFPLTMGILFAVGRHFSTPRLSANGEPGMEPLIHDLARTIAAGLFVVFLGGMIIVIFVVCFSVVFSGGSSCRRVCDQSRCWRICADGPADGGYIGYSHVIEPERWER